LCTIVNNIFVTSAVEVVFCLRFICSSVSRITRKAI